MYVGEGQEAVCGCVLGFPTSRTAAPVSGSSRGSGDPPLQHAGEVDWNIQQPLAQMMLNQGQSNSQSDLAADNVAEPGPEGNIH